MKRDNHTNREIQRNSKKKLSAQSKEKFEKLRKQEFHNKFKINRSKDNDCLNINHSNINIPSNNNFHCKESNQNLGAFHHLAPLKKSSRLGNQIISVKHTLKGDRDTYDDAPWDENGKPKD